MGGGASAAPVREASSQLANASVEDVATALTGVPLEAKHRLVAALEGFDTNVAAVSSTNSGVGAVSAGADDIPEEWGWPKKSYEPEDLKEYVYKATQATFQERWDESLEKRAIDSKLEDHIAEKAFANLLLNKEGTGDTPREEGIDPNAYKKGRWYRFLNYKGDCYVFVHNYTRDITATRPENFTDLTDEEKKRLRKLGTYIKELPREIERIYDRSKAIPIIYGTAETCHALKTFFEYDKGCTLLDLKNLKRVNSKALEDSRQAIVTAMKLGTTLAVYLGDNIPELEEKICINKNSNTFPRAVFRHGGLQNETVREKIYRDDDKEGGQCVVRDGFRICLVLPYDGINENSSMRKEELPSKIPNFKDMEEVRCYNDDDKIKLLAAMAAGTA
jgi:hypothetical protein